MNIDLLTSILGDIRILTLSRIDQSTLPVERLEHLTKLIQPIWFIQAQGIVDNKYVISLDVVS